MFCFLDLGFDLDERENKNENKNKNENEKLFFGEKFVLKEPPYWWNNLKKKFSVDKIVTKHILKYLNENNEFEFGKDRIGTCF